jgi:hypothetical protein
MNKWLLLFGAVFVVVAADDYFLRNRLREAHRDAARAADVATRTMRTNSKLFEVATGCQTVLGETTIQKQKVALRYLSPEAKKMMKTLAEQKKNRSFKVASSDGPN